MLRLPGQALSLLAAMLLIVSPAEARFRYPEIEDVPVDRLVRNLEAELDSLRSSLADPDRYTEALRNLARVHAIAHASGVETLQVRSGTNDLFERPGGSGYLSSLGEPGGLSTDGQQHLRRAVMLYREIINRDMTDIRSRLGLAWVLEQAGQFDEALQRYRVVAAASWPIEQDYYFAESDDEFRFLYAGSVSIFQEAASAVLRYLNDDRDAEEIAELKGRLAQYDQLGRAITPILIPLKGDAEFDALIDADAGVKFDLDGSGLERTWGWITPQAAWLVWDPDDSGRIDSGLELFGSVGFFVFWNNGYSALAALDDNRDGQLAGAELAGLSLWTDADGDGFSDPGEVRSLHSHGIVSIATGWQTHPEGFPFNPAGVGMADGSTRASYDWIVESRAENVCYRISS